MSAPKPFKEQVEALAEEQGVSLAKLGWHAHDPNRRGTSQDTLNKALQGKRRLNEPILEAVAAALGVKPERFVEYRLERLRRQLDYREVGLQEAVATLDRIEKATQRVAAAPPALPSELGRTAPTAPTTEKKAPSKPRKAAGGSR
jgi:transcriptional regulator with XRE-family HTH domain